MLLACGKGSGDAPGWAEPAPLTRIWCLFEVYVALKESVPMTMTMQTSDATDFLTALGQGGMREVRVGWFGDR